MVEREGLLLTLEIVVWQNHFLSCGPLISFYCSFQQISQTLTSFRPKVALVAMMISGELLSTQEIILEPQKKLLSGPRFNLFGQA